MAFAQLPEESLRHILVKACTKSTIDLCRLPGVCKKFSKVLPPRIPAALLNPPQLPWSPSPAALMRLE